MYFKAIYRTIVSMSSFYVENFCLWVKTAVWDAPRRIYLDIDLEYQNLSRTSSRESSSE
jgi:hypothetical protein